MRPFRAVALVAIGVAFWAGLRAASISDEVARRFEPLVAAPVAPSGPPPETASQGVPLNGTPTYPDPEPSAAPAAREVMVYSYPARGAAGVPGVPQPLYRLRTRAAAAGEVEPSGDSASVTPPALAFSSQPARPTHVVAADPSHDIPPDMADAAYQAATRGYAFLRVGDRRSAASAFAVALSLDPEHPRADAWRKEQHRLSRWWRAEAYVFQRAGDGTLIRTPGLPAASNVLGGGQATAMLAITPNPLGRVPVELQARYSIPQNGFSRTDPGRAQAAIAIAVRPLRNIPITLVAERLFKLGSLARNDWQARAYGGTSRRVRGIDLSVFAEAGAVGKRPDTFAGAQFLAEKAIPLPGRLEAGLGLGLWGSMQRTDRTTDRVDIGPTLRLSHPKSPFALRVDYRAHVAGNAKPGSGVAMTVSSSF